MKNYINFLALFIILLGTACASPKPADNGLGESKSSQKSITSFAFLKSRNPQLTRDYFAYPNEVTGDIVLTIKQDSLVDTAELVATYSFIGSYVILDSVVQQSGVTLNDFRKSRRYRVFSENGKYKDYNVIIKFMLSYPYKPEAYDVGIVGDLAVGRYLQATYTFMDRNGENEDGTIIKWYIESGVSSGKFTIADTQIISSTNHSDAKLKIPEGKEGCRVRLSVTPMSDAEKDESKIGYETTITTQSCIKADFSGSMIIINEVCTFSSSHSRDEYVVLYNSSITDEEANLSGFKLEYYDDSKSDWVLYCDFDDTSKFFKPEKPSYPALQEFGVKTDIAVKGYYLVSRQETDKDVKRIADIILKTNPDINLLPESGSIRLVKKSNSKTVDLFAYGTTAIYEGEKIPGTSLPVHADGEMLKRLNNIDSNISEKDIKSRPKLTPLSSGKNIVDTSYGPQIFGRIKATSTKPSLENGDYGSVSTTYWLGGTADDEPDYYFHDWLYGGESETEYNWIIYYVNSSGDEVILNDSYPPGTPEEKKFSANPKGNRFNIYKNDYELIPPGYQAKIRLKITPVSFNPANGQNIRGNEITFDYDEPVTLFVPAKTKITKFKPSSNLVEIFLERGGTLHNLYIGHVYPVPNPGDVEGVTDPEVIECADSKIVSDVTKTYTTGEHLTICTKGAATADIHLVDPIFSFSDSALLGGMLEIKELRSWKEGTDREEPDFAYQDVLVYGLGNHISQKSIALKKYIVNINSLFREEYNPDTGLNKFDFSLGMWKLQDGIPAFEAFPPNLPVNPSNPLNDALEAMTDSDYHNSLNTDTDYLKISADINSYIISKDDGDDVFEQKTDPDDLSIDYYLTTPEYEYVYNGSYYIKKLDNYRTLIQAHLSSRIPLLDINQKHAFNYCLYLEDSAGLTLSFLSRDDSTLGIPFPTLYPNNVFSTYENPIYIARISLTQIAGSWQQNIYQNFSAYTKLGPATTPDFASYYPVPKFTDRVIHRKKNAAPSPTYVDTNDISDFIINSVW